MRLLIIFATCILASCIQENRPCIPSPLPVLFRIVTPNGTDLLNPANSGAYDTADILMYSNLSPTAFKLTILPNNTADSFLLSTNIYHNWKNADQYFLQFPDGDIDTITTTQNLVNKSCGTYELLTLRYNNVAITPGILANTTYGPAPGYTIIKK